MMLGICDLKPQIQITRTDVECPVRGCSQRVHRQIKTFKREKCFQCPDHLIYISPTTFEYNEETENLLWQDAEDLRLFNAIKTVKRESRIGRDNSEDALTWNVFRYLERNELLAPMLSHITQTEHKKVELIYWSYSQESHGSWPQLNHARREFGEKINRSSEPDLIAVSDKGFFFIETKFTASNNTTPSSEKNRDNYLTGGDNWWREVFCNDYKTAAIDARKYELCRFWLLGTWLAKEINRNFHLMNVVLSTRERHIEQQFGSHIQAAPHQQFVRFTWEDIYSYINENATANSEKNVVLAYFKNKTIGYKKKTAKGNSVGEVQQAFSLV